MSVMFRDKPQNTRHGTPLLKIRKIHDVKQFVVSNKLSELLNKMSGTVLEGELSLSRTLQSIVVARFNSGTCLNVNP